MTKKSKKGKQQSSTPINTGKSKVPLQATPKWIVPTILIITFIAYLPALQAGFVNWDDGDYVYENLMIRDLSNIQAFFTTPIQGNYHPITMISLAINYSMSGLEAWSYHLFNIIFHLINCILVFRLCMRLTNSNLIIAFTTSILFAIHPMHVESVAWVTERKDVLYSLFFLAGLISYTRFLDEHSKKQYWWAVLFLALSIASKPAAVVFPLVLFCIDYLRSRAFTVKLFLEKAPFLVLSLIGGILTIIGQKEAGATGEAYFSLGNNILFGFYGIMMYVWKMILPINLAAFYPFPPINASLPAIYYIAPVFTLILLGVLYFTWKKNKTISFGILFYLVNLLLVLQVFSVGSAVIAERYTYIPYIGLFMILGWLLNRYTRSNFSKAVPYTLGVAIVLSILTYRQAETWNSGASLWDQAIKAQPSSKAYNNRAILFRQENNYDKALEYYNQAILMNAADHESHNNRGNVYNNMKQYDLALADYRQSIQIKPDYNVAYDNLGGVYAIKGQYDSALFYLNKSIELDPSYKPPYNNRALTYMSLNKHEEAIKDWKSYLAIDPTAADVYNTIGICYRILGNNQEALGYINHAIQLEPVPGFFLNRSYTYFNLNNKEQAKADALAARQGGVNLDANYASQLGIQ